MKRSSLTSVHLFARRLLVVGRGTTGGKDPSGEAQRPHVLPLPLGFAIELVAGAAAGQSAD